MYVDVKINYSAQVWLTDDNTDLWHRGAGAKSGFGCTCNTGLNPKNNKENVEYCQTISCPYQLNAPANQQSPLHHILCELRGWEKLPQRANHRQAPVPLASRGIIHQHLRVRRKKHICK